MSLRSPVTSLEIQREYMVAKISKKVEIPKWANECISSPQKGLEDFLRQLCKLGNAPYAHIRVRSRSGKFYKLAESIGPYKNIGWERRFQYLDKKPSESIFYNFLDYKTSQDCQRLKNKFSPNTEAHKYLDSLSHGFWLPIRINKNIDLGYITLSWDTDIKNKEGASKVKKYLKSNSNYLPLVYQASRNVIADKHLASLWSEAAIISSATEEHECYNRIGEACLKLWGEDATVYIFKITEDNKHYEVTTTVGRRANEVKKRAYKQNFQLNKGLVGYLHRHKQALLSYSLSKDNRFKYQSLRESGETTGSAIATLISDTSQKNSLAFISVEHERENYFDNDDIRYIMGIARIGYENIVSLRSIKERRAREFDTLFTQMAHDIVEPVQALVADADVLKFETNKALTHIYEDKYIEDYLSKTLSRVTNFLDEALNLNKRVRQQLDMGVGGDSKMTQSKIKIYTMLNTLVDIWENRAESQGVELKRLYDSLRDARVHCDESDLKAAIGHLITNAIKYSFWGRTQFEKGISKHGRYISIVGRQRNGMVVIEFQNYGIGILKRELSRIGEKFYRGELARKEGRAGTGRGLWSVKSFLDSIGGKLNIASIPKSSDIHGPYSTTIAIQLPIYKSEDNEYV